MRETSQGGWCWGAGSAVTWVLTATLLVATPVLAEEGVPGLLVSRLLVKGEEVAVTDAAECTVGDATTEIRQGVRLLPGAVVRLFYPEVQVHLTGRNSHIVLECAECSPSQPLELTVGDPGEKKPFRQKRGNVTYDVEAPQGGWFGVLLEVLRGKEEVVVPVAVRGTRFLLEPGRADGLVTVTRGTVQVADNHLGRVELLDVTEGMAVSGDPGQLRLMAAHPVRMEYADNVTGPRPTLFLERGWPVKWRPKTIYAAPPRHPDGPSTWPHWLLISGGGAAIAAGGVIHFLALQAEADASAEARALCSTEARKVGSGQAQLIADERYDQLYQNQVRPREISAYVLYGAGAAMVAGGVIWHMVSWNSAASSRSVSWQMVPLPGGGLVLDAGWEF